MVKGIDLDIQEGEFTVLVGPSGCGKTTLLRSIAGLEPIDEGTISIGGPATTVTIPSGDDANITFTGTTGQHLGFELSDVTIGTSSCCSAP